jgi:hypothetical protein
VTINGDVQGYEIINVLKVLQALNEEHSEISRWAPEDGEPQRVGTYFGIAKIVHSHPIGF